MFHCPNHNAFRTVHLDILAQQEVCTWATVSSVSATATLTPATPRLASARYEALGSQRSCCDWYIAPWWDGQISKRDMFPPPELPAQHPGGALWSVRSWLLWWLRCWHSGGLPALRLPSHWPRQPVSPGTDSKTSHSTSIYSSRQRCVRPTLSCLQQILLSREFWSQLTRNIVCSLPHWNHLIVCPH